MLEGKLGSDVLVHESFAAWAETRPEALAVAWHGGSLTYGELNARANRLARHLRDRGVAPEVPVGILTRRSAEMLVGILGVLKAGGCYLPLDPAYPEERLATTLADAGARLLLSTGELVAERPSVPAAVPELFLLDEDWEGLAGLADENLEPLAGPRNLAYVIYTSGSTGRPKGVEVEHRGLSNLASWHRQAYDVSPADRATRLAGSAFDASVWEVWPYLTAGASLHLPADELLLSPPDLVAWLAREEITLCFLPTPLAEAVLEEPWPDGAPLRALLTGGDRLHRGLGPEHSFGLFNHYGPTENSVVTTWCRVAPGEGAPPIGRAIDGVEVWTMSPDLLPVALGEPGELWTGGVSLARGYRARPDLTADRFVPDPFATAPGARLYRTGDLVRELPTGDLDFLGRIDFQVKVRGFRIELGEIEVALRRQPSVREGVVLARDDGRGGKRLVGYVVARGAAARTELAGELEAALARSLPEYMVPTAWVVLEALPLTPNGKVDRAALPEPERQEEAYLAPRTAREKALAAIFAEVLGLERVGVEESFFALGGHSLQATQVVSRLRSRLRLELTPSALFEHPTVAALAAALVEGEGLEGWEIRPLAREGEEHTLQPSFAQQGLWLGSRWSSEPALYNTPFALELSGPLDVSSLARALTEIVARHETLRGSFREVEGRPVLSVRRRLEAPLPVCDLSGLPADLAEAEEERISDTEARRAFDLERGPMLRTLLLRRAPLDHRLLTLMHHIVSDDWSISVLANELADLYTAFSEGRPSPLPPLAVQYGDFAAWQREWLSGPVLERQLGWWREALRGPLPVLELPADRPRPTRRSFRGARLKTVIPRERLEALAVVGRRAEASLFMSLLAALDVLLLRATGSSDLVVGAPIANRNRVELEGLIGFFVNTLTLRAEVAGESGFLDVLRQVRRTLVGAYEHQDLPFERLVEELSPERDTSRNPLVDVFVIMANAVRLPSRLGPGLDLRLRELEIGLAKVDLSLFLEETPEGLALLWEYSTDLFDRTTIARMAGHLEILMAGLAATPEAPVLELPLLSAAERSQLASWSGTRAPLPRAATLHGLFTAQAARTPDAVAVVDAESTLTYAELDERSDRLARRLAGLGAGVESRLGLLLERSPEMVIALLAVLKAGGAYVPLDPDYPAERLAGMLEDAGTFAVLAQQRLAGRLPEGTRVLFVDADDAPVPSGQLPPEVPDSALAYLIFTSGSTGRPKAAMVPHRAIVNHMLWMQAELPLDPDDRVLQKTSFSFDASVWEFWAPLAAGATLVMARPGEHRDPGALIRTIKEREVTVLQAVPSLLRALLEDGRLGECRSLRRVFCGGEALTADVQTAFFNTLEAELVNLYGPTETTVEVTSWRCLPERADRPALLGGPITNASLHVLGPRLEPCPVGVPGELFVGGLPVARGYHGRPEETAARFVPDPFAGEPAGESGGRLYRTGDLVRWRTDGLLEYLGRIDQQVKIRGFRIEPGEIEAALAAHPKVAEAAVLAVPGPGGHRLVAYVADGPGEAELRDFAAARLPEHMVPGVWIFLEALPLTPNGKVDRRALSRLAADSGLPAGEEYVAPRGEVEEVVERIIANLLDLERVGASDNFFHRGGHSLLAARLVARIREMLAVDLPLRAVFEAPTVAGLARLIAEGRGSLHALRLLPRTSGEEQPASFAQQRLWFLDRLRPDSTAYNMPMAFRIRGPLQPAVLGASLDEIVRRHEVLRTVFTMKDGQPIQVIRPFEPRGLPVVDLGRCPEPLRATEAALLEAEWSGRPFDLARGPVLRASLLHLSDGDHRLLVNIHHIASDGWSNGILIQEMGTLYQAFAAGLPSPLPPLPVQYADFAVWQRGWLQGDTLEEQLAFWRSRLGNDPEPLELPADRPRPAVQSGRGALEQRSLPSSGGGLEQLARSRGATPFMAFLAGFQTLLHRYTGRAELSVGTPVANRSLLETEGLIGCFVNTLVLHTDLSADPQFPELLDRVRETALAAYAHQELPFERLVEELVPGRDLSRTPLCQVAFAVQQEEIAEPVFGPELQVESNGGSGGTAKFDLALFVGRSEAGTDLLAEYSTDLFEAATVQRMLGHLGVLIAGIEQNQMARLSELPLLSEAELEQLLVEWPATASRYPSEIPAHRLFEAQVKRSPEAVAVITGEVSLSYGELNARADRAAAALRAVGVGPEVPVALVLERSVEMVVALIAVLKAGGMYVPLDPKDPTERLRFVLEDTRAPVVIARGGSGVEALTAACEHRPRLLFVEDLATASPAREGSVQEMDASGLAYIIYTSGSTGRPKGVAVPHRAIARLVLNTEYIHLGPGDRVGHLSNPAFDAAIFEVWGALLTGAAIVVIPREIALAPAALAGELERRRVTSLFLTTALFNLVIREAPRAFATLRDLLFGGEATDPQWVRACLEASPERLLNVYGPTESTTFSTWHPIHSAPPGELVPIGRPLANTRTYVVDEWQRPVPVGIAGELLIGGDGLARGYFGRPELTAERFVPDPFGYGDRLYRTGDLVRYRPSGEIEFLGRIDHQVKLRGFRIELGEIEAALNQLRGVEATVVMVREDAGDRRLVAYVVGAPGEELTTTVLRQYLRERLPEYMVPAAFILLESLPLNPNGKVDRRALPAPEESLATGGPEFVAPRTPLESQVAEIWNAVLSREKIGIHDTFWDLGGHSLLATRVLARLYEAMGVELPLQTLFEHPTLLEFAETVGQALLSSGVEEVNQYLAELEGLSEEEIRQLLAEESLELGQ